MEDVRFEVFDRAIKYGIESLTAAERELYLIQDFIIEYEMNSLSGYFYDRLPEIKIVQETINAMRANNMHELSSLLDEALNLFQEYVDPKETTTWGEILKKYDPTDLLGDIEGRIDKLLNYGITF